MFNIRLKEFEMLKNSVSLFYNPIVSVIEEQPTGIKLELYDLQAEPFLKTRQKKGARLH